jgi:hypothetical protein
VGEHAASEEELGEERRGREAAERERDDLRRELEALRESPGATESATTEPERGVAFLYGALSVSSVPLYLASVVAP